MSARPTLVVDPDGNAARELCEHLARAGFPADIAITYSAARTMTSIQTYGSLVCFVDLNLPSHREGLDALRAQLPRTWIIAISSTTPADTERLANHSGADALLNQPFSMEDLTSRLAAFSLRARPSGADG